MGGGAGLGEVPHAALLEAVSTAPLWQACPGCPPREVSTEEQTTENQVQESRGRIRRRQAPRRRGDISAAPGADTLAGRWAETRGVPVEAYPVDLERHGCAAGPIRNKRMLEEGRPDLVVAFPGTADVVQQARAASVRSSRPKLSGRAD